MLRLQKKINDLRAVPGPVAIPRSRIQRHANFFVARAARLLCLRLNCESNYMKIHCIFILRWVNN